MIQQNERQQNKMQAHYQEAPFLSLVSSHDSSFNNSDNIYKISPKVSMLLEACRLRRKHTKESSLKAIEIIVKSLQTEGRHCITYYLLAQAYQESKNQNLGKVYQDYSSQPELFQKQKKIKEWYSPKIIYCYQNSVKQDPYFEPAYRELATFYMNQGLKNQAREVYQQWSKISDNGQIFKKIAEIYKSQQDKRQEANYYLKAMLRRRKESTQRKQFTEQEQISLIYSSQ